MVSLKKLELELQNAKGLLTSKMATSQDPERVFDPFLPLSLALTSTGISTFNHKLNLVNNRLKETSAKLEVSKEKYRAIRAKVSLAFVAVVIVIV